MKRTSCCRSRRLSLWRMFLDPVDEIGPSFAQSAPGRCDVVGFTGWSRILPPVRCAYAVGVDAVEMDQVLVGFGDVEEDAGPETRAGRVGPPRGTRAPHVWST